MDQLAINEFDLCFKLLKNTEKLLLSKEEAEIPQDRKRSLLSLTFNNLGCYYKK